MEIAQASFSPVLQRFADLILRALVQFDQRRVSSKVFRDIGTLQRRAFGRQAAANAELRSELATPCRSRLPREVAARAESWNIYPRDSRKQINVYQKSLCKYILTRDEIRAGKYLEERTSKEVVLVDRARCDWSARFQSRSKQVRTYDETSARPERFSCLLPTSYLAVSRIRYKAAL